LGDLGRRTYGLDEQDLLWVEIHAVRLEEFFAASDEDVSGLLGFRVCSGDDAIDFRQNGLVSQAPCAGLQMTWVVAILGWI
jgi:hypothetical protein